jgi:hypothetical protein
MAEKFDKGSFIVLVLLALMGAVITFYEIKQDRAMEEIISIADGRTEYLLDRVNALSDKVGLPKK